MRNLTKRSVAGIAIAFLLGTFLVLPAQSSSARAYRGDRNTGASRTSPEESEISWSSPTGSP